MIKVKVIKPKVKFDPRILYNEIYKESEKIGKDGASILKDDVKTWRHKPNFPVRIDADTKKILIDVLVTGRSAQIYRYVDEGTIPHDIPKKAGAKTLRFKWDGPGSYSPKTIPGVSGSRKSSQRGKIVYRKKVRHPGTKPRHFYKNAEKLWIPKIKRRLQDAIERGVKLSGHAYKKR